MKKLLIILLISNISLGQNFPGNDAILLLNTDIKVKERDERLHQFGFQNFYINDEMIEVFDPIIKPKTYWKGSHGLYTKTKYSGVAGKTFKVLSVDPYYTTFYGRKYKLKIENVETGIIYFDYNPKYESQFYFEVVGGLKVPPGFYCDQIKTKSDKFDGTITSRYDYFEGISFMKITKDNSSKISMSFRKNGSTINTGEKGLIVLLENNKRIERPNASIDADVSTNGSGFVYSAFIILTQEEIKLIIENKITDYRLYIYDGVVEEGEKLSEYLKCLNNLK